MPSVRGFFAVGQFAVRKNVTFGQVSFGQIRLVRFGQVFFSHGKLSYGEKSQSRCQDELLVFPLVQGCPDTMRKGNIWQGACEGLQAKHRVCCMYIYIVPGIEIVPNVSFSVAAPFQIHIYIDCIYHGTIYSINRSYMNHSAEFQKTYDYTYSRVGVLHLVY